VNGRRVVEPSRHVRNVIATQIQVPAYGYVVTREGVWCVGGVRGDDPRSDNTNLGKEQQSEWASSRRRALIGPFGKLAASKSYIIRKSVCAVKLHLHRPSSQTQSRRHVERSKSERLLEWCSTSVGRKFQTRVSKL
jgi:hypothetical protein